MSVALKQNNGVFEITIQTHRDERERASTGTHTQTVNFFCHTSEQIGSYAHVITKQQFNKGG